MIPIASIDSSAGPNRHLPLAAGGSIVTALTITTVSSTVRGAETESSSAEDGAQRADIYLS